MELRSRNAMTDESARTPMTKEPNFVYYLRKDLRFAIRFNFVFLILRWYPHSLLILF